VGQGHSGNKFTIILRHMQSCPNSSSSSTHAPTVAAIAAAVASVKQGGFINYFGFQRVGEPVLSRALTAESTGECKKSGEDSGCNDNNNDDNCGVGSSIGLSTSKPSEMDVDTPSESRAAATTVSEDNGISNKSVAIDAPSQWDGAPAWKVATVVV